MLNKIIEYGLYLLVFLLPVGTRWIIKAGALNGGPWEYGTYSLYATDILLFIVLSLFILRQLVLRLCRLAEFFAMEDGRLLDPQPQLPFNRQIHNRKIIWRLIGGLLLISWASIFLAGSHLLALYKFGWLILGIGLFWLVSRAAYSRGRLIWSLFFGIALQAGLAIWQFLTQSTFAYKWLGLALHQASDLGASVVEAVGADGVGERWLRAYGGLDHPNILGGILAIGIILVINQIIIYEKCFRITNYELRITDKISSSAEASEDKQNSKLYNIKFLTSYFLLLTFTAALFFSFSRSAWLGLAAGLGLMIFLAVKDKNLKSQKNLAEIILVMGILFFTLFSQSENLLTTRLSGQGRLENKSTSERLASYQESWQMIKNHWAAGVGLGNYTLALSRQTPGQASYYYQPAHNVFILVLSEVGLVGFMFFIALLFVIARSLKTSCHCGLDPQSRNLFSAANLDSRLRGNDKRGEVACLPAYLPTGQAGRTGRPDRQARNENMVAILASLAVILSLDHWLWSLHFGVLFFWLTMGLMIKTSDVYQTSDVCGDCG